MTDPGPPIPDFEILDWSETPLGVLCLRRRAVLSRPGTTVTEVTLDHELLMSSLNAKSEEALATRALARHGVGQSAAPRDVLVGGLGLGHTAWAALQGEQVGTVRVVEYLPRVIAWLEEGRTPLSAALNGDPRLHVQEGDVYGLLLDAPTRTFDLILVDVDHSPREPLGPASLTFHEAPGLRAVAAHLAPGGLLGVWSAEPDPAFVAALEQVFDEVTTERVPWVNELVDDGEATEDFLFFARNT